MLPHPLTNFEIQKYHQNEPIFNGVYSRNNLTKLNDTAYVINHDEYKSIGTHWIPLYVKDDYVTCCDSSGVEHIPKQIEKIIGSKNITTNIYKIQALDSVISGYFFIGYINLMLKGKGVLDNTNLFSPNKYEKNDKIILVYF